MILAIYTDVGGGECNLYLIINKQVCFALSGHLKNVFYNLFTTKVIYKLKIQGIAQTLSATKGMTSAFGA